MHVSAVHCPLQGVKNMHRHDFFEVFWVNSGVGHHLIDGMETPERLVAGQLWYIRPEDGHGFEAGASSEPFSCMNVAFPAPAWQELRNRYELEPHPFFDDSLSRPAMLDAPAGVRREISALFQQVLLRPVSALSRDAFLLDLALRTRAPGATEFRYDLPAWLRTGMMEMAHDPGTWSGGTSALARICGCDRSHLARVFRQYLEMTPTHWIRELRLERAARLLETTGLSITDVAYESGFENLSHFHRSFRKKFGKTPFHYRKTLRREAM